MADCETKQKLQEPFPAEDIEFRVGATNAEKTKGLALAYVTNRAIQNRLDEVFGPFGWQNEFKEWKGNSQICGISVWDENKKQWITKWDGADDSQTEAVKGGLSDSMKRAAYQWGIGRYLYKLPSVWAKIKKQGNSYVIEEKPNLPAWALPKGAPPQNSAPTQEKHSEPSQETPTGAPDEPPKPKKNECATFWQSIKNLGCTEEEVHNRFGSIKEKTPKERNEIIMTLSKEKRGAA